MQTRHFNETEIGKIENLVFQGGSVKGVAYLGAWEALLELNLDPSKIQRVAGTSAGSITALLLALGYHDPATILAMLESLEFIDMLDEPHAKFPVRNLLLKAKEVSSSGKTGSSYASFKLLSLAAPKLIYRFINQRGIFDGEYLLNWFETLIKERTGIDHCTFGELDEIKNTFPELNFKELYVVAVDMDTGLAETFSAKHKPNLIISEAIRASMSIPLVYNPHTLRFKNKNGLLYKDEKNDIYVDGGLMDNYAINTFNDINEGKNTLGFQLMKRKHIDDLDGVGEAPRKKTETSVGFVKALMETYSAKQRSDHRKSNFDKARSVKIDTVGVGTLDFDLSQEKKRALILSGRAGVINYFDAKLNPDNSAIVNLMISENKSTEQSVSQNKMNEVTVYIWPSKASPKQSGVGYGHVSLQIQDRYISLWPSIEESPHKQHSKGFNYMNNGIFASRAHRFQPSLSEDIKAEKNTQPFYTETFSSLNVEGMLTRLAELEVKMQGWKYLPGLCDDLQSCASLVWELFVAGDIKNLVGFPDHVGVSSVGSFDGFKLMVSGERKSRSDASIAGSIYSAEMALSSHIKSPDSLIEILKKAKAKDSKFISSQDFRIGRR